MKKHIKAYFTAFKLRALLLLQYKLAAIAGIATQIMFGLFMIMAAEVFYNSNPQAQSISFSQTVTYYWLGQALLGILPWNGDRDIINTVRTGQIAYELCRPLNLYDLWFARSLAYRIIPTLMRAIPQFIFSLFIIKAPYNMTPPSLPAFIAFLLSLIGALALSCSLTNIIYVTMMYTIAGEGITRLMPAVVMLFSGSLIPLQLFPDWMQGFLKYQPFSGILNVPNSFFIGIYPPKEIFFMLGVQLLWAALFVLFGKWLLSRGLRRVIITGG